MKNKRIIANWKMHKGIEEACEFLNYLKNLKRKVSIAPPFTLIQPLSNYLREHSIENVVIGAQNMHDCLKGAFTGEISLEMLKEVGAQFVLLGHSERRHLFNESDPFIQRKVKRALNGAFSFILCVGETEEEREAGVTDEVLKRQLTTALDGISVSHLPLITIAYEPVWAIGTGKTATPESAQEAHLLIRKFIAELVGEKEALSVPIVYGGSVNPSNIKELVSQSAIEGALVGGASLDSETFLKIIHYDQEIVSK